MSVWDDEEEAGGEGPRGFGALRSRSRRAVFKCISTSGRVLRMRVRMRYDSCGQRSSRRACFSSMSYCSEDCQVNDWKACRGSRRQRLGTDVLLLQLRKSVCTKES